ncbi:MAG: RluA family pseudouridine synthase [Comamonadaceae bacterium]|nr:MAG: RluA family pseudouridine synthase [Comamonadaceae bacterium]
MTAPCPADLRCLHVDEDLLVLDKPCGLLCVPGRGEDKQDCLSARAQRAWPDALVVHRLDQATSGIVLMARSAAVQRSLSHAFAQRQVHKRYQAVVHGRMAAPAGGGWAQIDLPIAADWERRPLRVVDAEHGKPSLTEWRVLAAETAHADAAATLVGAVDTVDTVDAPGAAGAAKSSAVTRIELQPITGRTHQLRVHLSAVGHAILGDMLYADAAVQALSPRLLLHATRLAFVHPRSGETVQFSSAPDF